jgi:hypothetical protein
MKRLLLGIAILGGAAVLGGCPIYPGDQGNSEYRVCDANGCYSCPDTTYSGACITWQCSTDSDCGYGYACSSQGQCVVTSPPPPPPADAGGGDCSVNGCPDGYVCKLSNGVAQCVTLGGSDAGGSSSSSSSGGASDSGSKADGGGPSDASPIAGPCNADSECGGHGAKCVDGQCATQIALCSDGSQCNAAGSVCVDGLCEATCSATSPCPSGYGCDFNNGICNLNPGACTGSGASNCQGGATCVEGHCVPPCAASAEGGAACAAGQVCVNGGCIPDQAATLACANDGDQGQLANTCPSGSTCIHHDCYVACDPDASAICGNAASGNTSVCKNVTIETGTYGVCGSATALGSDCDPAQGKYCAKGICIDGYCK